MCGRFTLTVSAEELQQIFPEISVPELYAPRYNIAPSQPLAAIALNSLGKPTLQHFQWGLVPVWAKDPSIGQKLINARAETITEKPSYRTAFQKRRCLVLADGFYEWQAGTDPKSKTPMYIQLQDGKPFTIGGLWESWRSAEGDLLLSCTLVTTSANELLRPVHERMPVIIPPQERRAWLDARTPIEQAQALCRPYPAPQMRYYAVSNHVNSPFNEGATCILPV